MKKLTTAILATAVAFGSTSCKKDLIGEGPVKTETRTVPAFNTIDLHMNGNVYYTHSAERKIEITAKQSIHSQLETSVADNKLTIRYKNGKTYDADETIRINISGPDVNSFMLHTSGSIYVVNDIRPASLLLRTYGSGNISLRGVFTDHIDAESKVSGRITATNGSANKMELRSDASGRIDMAAITAKTATARTVGSGDIFVRASENLDVTIKGSGSVYFTGYPSISTHISGTGRLIHL